MTDSLQTRYQAQLSEKVATLQERLLPFAAPDLEVFESVPEGYRMRAEFRVWHEGDDLFYIMFHPGTREKYRVDTFAPGAPLINQLMPAVLAYIKELPLLRNRLFQVDFLTTTTGEATISLLYHRQLDDEWLGAAEAMRDIFQTYGNIELIGRARKQKLLVNNDRVVESLSIAGRDYRFEQIENSFTQPNAGVNVKMIEWALNCTKESPSDLLELYCGNGNFSLPLAQNFERVLGTEISRTSVRSAQTNIAMNQLENVKVARMSAEEVAAAMAGTLDSKRVEELELADYNFETVLVDPPRAGLDAETLKMVQQYERILYISCNPETLAENLETLHVTHEIQRAALFDQFPFTEHTEAGVYLVRRS